MICLFWCSLFFIAYTYLGYPVTLWLLTRFVRHPSAEAKDAAPPSVSVVIAARNEEKKICRRIRNLAGQGYPAALEIILVSDNSTDATVAEAERLAGELAAAGIGLQVLTQGSGSGKPSAVNKGVAAASGEIIVFADARQRFVPGALTALVSGFSDPEVGCVSGELVFVDSAEGGLQVEMGAYWHYEKAIRRMESATGSVIGATGAIYAVRRQLYKELPAATLLDDVLTPINILCQQKRVLFDGRAVATDIVSSSVDDEWRRKVRTLAGNWQLIGQGVLRRSLAHRFFFRFFWHKMARILVPFALPLLLLSSFCGDNRLLYIFGLGQILFYLIALSGWKLSRFSNNSLVKLCYFFCVLNWAAVVGFWLWVTGREKDAWRGEKSADSGAGQR